MEINLLRLIQTIARYSIIMCYKNCVRLGHSCSNWFAKKINVKKNERYSEILKMET